LETDRSLRQIADPPHSALLMQRAPMLGWPPPPAVPPPAPALAVAPAPAAQVSTPDLYDVLLHEPARRPEVEAFAAQNAIRVVAASNRKLRVEATPEQADAINDLDGVVLVDEYVPPKLYVDRARLVVWPAAPLPAPLTGQGEIVGVADSGIDEAHVVFQGRVHKVVARARAGDASDPHGHGTHVAATIVGGQGPQLGIAPGAKLVFQSVMDDTGDLSGLPLELDTLFAEAYAEGARIHNDSWGADLAAAYSVTSLEVDRFVHEHKDMLVVVAAGNAGSSVDPMPGPRRTQVGFVEWGSVGAPATSKNALVVGASRSDRKDGGLAKRKYGDVWPGEFADPPIAVQAVSGDPECMAGFSSRGPCNDHRIKPDVVAPGTDILSARAATAPPSNFAEVIQRDGAAYGYMSGTSMAAPIVAGVAALIREYLRVERGHPEPSAALLKAIIVNGTRRLAGADATADHPELPNFHQGFGAIHLPTTLPLDRSFALAFVDNWKTPQDHLTKPGMRRRFRFTTTKPGALRLTLAYTDPPGRGVQNDLSLFVEMPGGVKRLGNENVPLAVFRPDPDNNVETLRLENAPAGDYLIQVTSTTILHPPQDFALVVAGALAKPALDPA